MVLVGKRALQSVAAVAVLATALSACGSSSSSGGSSKGSFTLWSMWVKGQPGQKVIQQEADAFTKQTGIKVNIVWKGQNVGNALLPTLNTANPPTDMVEAGGIATHLAPTGQMLDLSSLYNQPVFGDTQTVGDVVGDYKTLAEPLNESTGAHGSPFAVPYWIATYGIYYNGANFASYKTSPPKTWDAFFQTLDAQKAKGRRPLALDGSITGYNALYFTYFARSILGDGALTKAALDKTGASWAQPGMLQAAQLVEKLAKGGYFIKGYDGSKFPAMEDAWANNQSDFIMMGSWLPGEVAPAAAQGFDYQAFPFPAVDGHSIPKVNAVDYSFGIVKKSKHAAEAEKFIEFMLSKSAQQAVSTVGQEIPVRKDVAAPATAQGIKSLLDQGNMVSSESSTTTDVTGFDTKVLDPNDDDLVFGKITAQQFVEKMQQGAVTYWKSK